MGGGSQPIGIVQPSAGVSKYHRQEQEGGAQ
jgi:hypothetical protein